MMRLPDNCSFPGREHQPVIAPFIAVSRTKARRATRIDPRNKDASKPYALHLRERHHKALHPNVSTPVAISAVVPVVRYGSCGDFDTPRARIRRDKKTGKGGRARPITNSRLR